MNRAQISEAETRLVLHRRPTWMLLATWEVTETIRDAHDTPPRLVEAAVAFIDWTIDELDARHPDVLPRWHASTEAGRDVDLMALFALSPSRTATR